MKLLKIAIILSLFFVQYEAQAQSFLHAMATKYDYQHKQILNSKAPKTYISCQVIEQREIFSDNLSQGARRIVYTFAIDKNKQVYYKNENIDGVRLFNEDELIFYTQEKTNKGAIKDYMIIRYNIINRKTGAYQSYYLEGWTMPNRKEPVAIEGKGTGSCESSSFNKF